MVDERAHLELADRHIRESKKRIAQQEIMIQKLAADGRDTVAAEAILQTFRETLQLFLDHRVLIVEALEKQAAEAPPGDPPRG